MLQRSVVLRKYLRFFVIIIDMKGILIVLTICLAGCFSHAGKADAGGDPAPQGRVVAMCDSIRSDTIDLGTIRPGEIVRQNLRLHNGYGVPMVILSVTTSCGCTSVEFDRKPIPAGEDAAFSFRFDSRGFTGYQFKKITLKTSASSKPYSLFVTGEIVR